MRSRTCRRQPRANWTPADLPGSESISDRRFKPDAVAVPERSMLELVALSVYDELATVLTVQHEVAA